MPQITKVTVRPFTLVLAIFAAMVAAAILHTPFAQAAPTSVAVAASVTGAETQQASPANPQGDTAKDKANTKPQGLLNPQTTAADAPATAPTATDPAAPPSAVAVKYDESGFPQRPQGPVLDAAGILDSAAEAALDMRLREYNARTGRALVVATVPSLNDDSIEMYAVRLFEKWGIGGAETDQGLLLLVAPNERKVRIEVGYGLHQYVTDILSGRIIRDDITPAFQQGDYAAGIAAGIDALITQLDRDPADARAVAEAAAAAKNSSPSEAGATIGGVIFWIMMIVFFATVFSQGGGGKRRRYGDAGSVGNIILWHAIGSAMGSSSRDNDGFGGGFGGGGGGGFGGFGGGMSGGGGASGSW